MKLHLTLLNVRPSQTSIQDEPVIPDKSMERASQHAQVKIFPAMYNYRISVSSIRDLGDIRIFRMYDATNTFELKTSLMLAKY